MLSIFARINGFDAVSSYLNRNPSLRENWHFLVAASLVALLWYLLYYLERVGTKTSRRLPETPQGLLEELCQRHRLSRNERKLLVRVATNHSHPAVVCVDPRFLLEYATQEDPESEAARALAIKLFGAVVTNPA